MIALSRWWNIQRLSSLLRLSSSLKLLNFHFLKLLHRHVKARGWRQTIHDVWVLGRMKGRHPNKPNNQVFSNTNVPIDYSDAGMPRNNATNCFPLRLSQLQLIHDLPCPPSNKYWKMQFLLQCVFATWQYDTISSYIELVQPVAFRGFPKIVGNIMMMYFLLFEDVEALESVAFSLWFFIVISRAFTESPCLGLCTHRQKGNWSHELLLNLYSKGGPSGPKLYAHKDLSALTLLCFWHVFLLLKGRAGFAVQNLLFASFASGAGHDMCVAYYISFGSAK